MKHIVNLVLSQPYHEHVSLRSRTKSHNHIVEARTAEEAMNRASRQYTALGYKVHTATIVEQKIEKPEPKQNVVLKTKEESIEEALLPKQQAVADKLKDTELAANKEKAGFKYGKALRAAKVAAKKLKEESEIQYIEEKLTADDPASKWISDFVKSDNPKFAGKSKKERINQALGAYYAAKRGNVEEGYDPPSAEIAKMLVKKHGAGNVTKQHILDMEADRDSSKALDHDEIMKHVKKMTEEVEQTDEAVRVVDRWHPGVPHDNQKRKDIAATVKKIRKDPDARGGMTGFNRYQDFFGGRNARLGAERTPVGEEVEQIDEQSPAEIKAKYYHDKFDKVKPVKAYDKEGKLVGRYRSMDHAKQMKPGHTYKVEEGVELDEANMRFDYEAAARPKSSDVKNFLNRDKNARAAAASKKYIRRMTKLGGLGPNQTKKDTEAHMKAQFEEVDEATDPGKLRVVNKKVESQASKDTKKSEKKMKATEKAMQIAKGKKNPVNLKPVLGGDKLQNA